MKECLHLITNVHSLFGLALLLDLLNREVVETVELMLIVTLDRHVFRLEILDNAFGGIHSQLMETIDLIQGLQIPFIFQFMTKITLFGQARSLAEQDAQVAHLNVM